MKFFATAILSAAVVSADAIFSVSDFSASCIPHSVECYYSFGVVQIGNGETIPVNCSVSTASDNTLPSTVGTCEESSRVFVVNRNDTGLTLIVSEPVTPASTESGSHLIPKSEIITVNDQVAQFERYDGPTSFTLDS